MRFYLGEMALKRVYLGEKLIISDEEEQVEAGREIRRDKNGLVTIYLPYRDRTITLTEDWLGVIGMMYSGAYVGSALFSEIKWTAYQSESLRSRFKATIASQFPIIVDNENMMKWEVKELRSALQDYGMEYNFWDLVVPTFIDRGPQDQVYSFIKGLYLGSLSVLPPQETIDGPVVPLGSQTMYDSTVKLLNRISAHYIGNASDQSVVFTDPTLNSWLKDQKKGFKWT